jgi:hypothetical protein
MGFKIGRNPYQSEERPWEYVLVRHVPVEPDTFAFYGDGLLSDFDNVPTWKYATPHNIQRITPQNESCENCHENRDLFLTADDVAPDELEANASVIVDCAPDCAHESVIEEVEPGTCADITLFDTPIACTGCHPGAVEGDWELLSENLHPLDYLVEPAGEVILCQDCHSPEGNFDWAAEGFSDEEAAALIWTDHPSVDPVPCPSPGLNQAGVLGIGAAIAIVAAVPFVLRRNGH